MSPQFASYFYSERIKLAIDVGVCAKNAMCVSKYIIQDDLNCGIEGFFLFCHALKTLEFK